ncbi:polyamine-transporting ATPase 13A3 [Ixodes scapularis]
MNVSAYAQPDAAPRATTFASGYRGDCTVRLTPFPRDLAVFGVAAMRVLRVGRQITRCARCLRAGFGVLRNPFAWPVPRPGRPPISPGTRRCSSSSLFLRFGDWGRSPTVNRFLPGKCRKLGPPPMKDGVDYVNAHEEDQMEVVGYCADNLRTLATWCGVLLTAGFLRLLFHWHPAWMLYCTHRRCPLHQATKVLLVDQYQQLFVEPVQTILPSKVNVPLMVSVTGQEDFSPDGPNEMKELVTLKPGGAFETTESLVFFENKKVRYLWDHDLKVFTRLRGFDRNVPCSYFHQQKGISLQEQLVRRVLFGDNVISVQIQSVFRILFHEVLEPFYVFQVFSMAIWFSDNYYYYASCIIAMSALSLVSGVYQIRLEDFSPDGPNEMKELVTLKPGGAFETTESLVFFENKKVRYLWDHDLKVFTRLRGFDRNVPCSYFHQQKGISLQEQLVRRVLFGDNVISVQIQSVFRILFHEVLEPFYVFQVFSMAIWFSDNYYYYASCIIAMSALSLVSGVYQIRLNQKALSSTVHATDVVMVKRSKGVYENVPSEHLVPGDVMVVPRNGCVMQCDAVLTAGNCIVNESMLTGESVPVVKTPLPNPGVSQPSLDVPFHPKEHARHTLFCGTRIIQTRYYGTESVEALVVRTGFLTAKGELVRSIMFPKPVDFKFNRHIKNFLLFLASLASIGVIYTVVLKMMRGVAAGSIIVRSLDVVTIVIPPALPAAMTMGIVFAQSRLRSALVYCISPRSINISGCINCFCFDKTGTLTEEGLDLWGVVPASGGK